MLYDAVFLGLANTWMVIILSRDKCPAQYSILDFIVYDEAYVMFVFSVFSAVPYPIAIFCACLSTSLSKSCPLHFREINDVVHVLERLAMDRNSWRDLVGDRYASESGRR